MMVVSFIHRCRFSGLLVSQGINEITVNKKPRVTILSTGDELVTLDNTHLEYGQVSRYIIYTALSILLTKTTAT